MTVAPEAAGARVASEAADYTLRLRGVSKLYGRLTAVERLDLDVRTGEFVCLLGPSGCGKTTTLRMIAGFIRPTAGQIELAGVLVNDAPPYERNCGMVFQNYALFPHLTAFDNVAYGLKVRRMAKDEIRRRVQRAIEMVQMGGREHHYPRQLSGGQQQRIALARALVIEPSMLLLDEPLSNLDAKLRGQMREEIRSLVKSLGITTLFVTHDQEESLTMADRIVVMNHGRVEQIGGATEIYERPATAFVAAFVGTTNLLHGVRVVGNEGAAYRLETADGRSLHGQAAFDGPPPSEDLAYSIRPERVWLVPATPEAVAEWASRPNSFRGTVASKTYVGSTIRYRIALGGDLELLADQQNREQARLEAGDEALVWWEPRDALVVLGDHGAAEATAV